MNAYNLINSKAIAKHCRKIQHKLNTEELAGINKDDIKKLRSK